MPDETPVVDSQAEDTSYDSAFDDVFPSSKAEDSSPSGTVAEAKPEAKTDSEPKDTKPADAPVSPAEEPDPISALEESEELKNAWKLPTVGKELRKAYYLSKEYQKLYPTIDEARAFKDLFSTAEEAKEAISHARALKAFDSMWSSGDPQNYERILTGLKTTEPKLFEAFANTFSDVHYKLDPEGYRRDTQMRFADILNNFARVAQSTQDAELAAAIDLITEVAFGSKALPKRASKTPDDKDKTIEELRKQIDGRHRQEAAQRFEGFFENVNASVADSVRSDIVTMVNSLVPNGSISDKAKERIVNDIYDEVDAKLRGNKELVDLLRLNLQEGNLDKSHHERVFRIVQSRARTLIPEHTRNAVSTWTKDVLRINQNDIEKARAAGAKREPGGGGGNAHVPQVSKKDLEGSSLSDAYDKLMSGLG